MEFVEKSFENGLELVKIYSKTKNSYFTVAPERGAIVVLLNLSGKEILYLNEATLFDRTKNVRGGIPVLFPICGRVVDGKIFFKDQEFEMKNHGFARDSSSNIAGYVDMPDKNGIILRLSSNEFTKRFYPYDFELLLQYLLSDEMFEVKMIVKNEDSSIMPFYAGFHPYFLCNKDEFTLKLECERCFDDVEKRFIDLQDFKEIDFSKPEVNLDFLDVASSEVEITLDRDKKIVLLKDENFKNIVVWSLKDFDFVCVEPWMGEHEGYINNKFYYLEPGAIFEGWFAIKLANE